MKNVKYIIACFLFVGLVSCSDDNESTINNPTGGENVVDPNKWNVPQNEVLDGGPGKDGIPSVDDPQFSKQSDNDISSLYMDQLVVGLVHNRTARAYPHPILDWHEIVNDNIGDLSVAITYCPLTGTGIGWNREINNQITEFGVSGLLFDSNLMPYDRVTNSTWSQQRLDCVNGSHIGKEIEVVPLVETTLRTWLETYPDSEILNEDTGFNRNYGRYPYNDYRTNSSLIFPVSTQDNRFPSKERVLGVFVDAQVKAYRFNENSSETEVIQEDFNGASLVVVRNTEKNFIVAFENKDKLVFEATQNFPSVLTDENGNEYDITGQNIISDGSIGRSLPQMKSFIGYWFSWGTFYKDMEVSDL